MFNRDTAIEFLTTNCECWSGSQNQLEAMSDAQLKTIVAGMARSTFNAERCPDCGAMVAKDDKRCPNCGATLNAKAEGSNADLSDDSDGSDYIRAGGVDGENYEESESSTDYLDDDDDFPEKAERAVPRKKNPSRATATGNSLIEQLAASSHPRDQQTLVVINRMLADANEKKQSLIAGMTSHVRDPKLKRELIANFQSKSLAEIELMAASFSQLEPPKPPRPVASFPGFQADRSLASYLGAGGGPVPLFNRQTAEDKESILPLPSTDWKEVANEMRQAEGGSRR